MEFVCLGGWGWGWAGGGGGAGAGGWVLIVVVCVVVTIRFGIIYYTIISCHIIAGKGGGGVSLV